MTRTDVVRTEVRDGVATLTFDRPEKLNALSRELLRASIDALQAWRSDPAVGAIVVTGEGRAFCAGGDVSAMDARAGTTIESETDRMHEGQELAWLLHAVPKITIAAVNGFAMGAGLGIALSCDLRIASDAARFGTAYAKVGLDGDFGATWGLTSLVGPAKAKELLLLAEPFDAAAAERMGLVNRVVAADRLADEVRALATRIAAGPQIAYRAMKRNVNLATHAGFRTTLEAEAETHARVSQSEDHREGARAFVEKRAPVFRGR